MPHKSICMEHKSVILNTSQSTGGARDFVKNFGKFIIGQSQADQLALDVIERIQNPLRNRKKPNGVYVIVGPTGTGKTRTAKTLARLLHGDETAMIKVDMGDFKEPHQMMDLKGGSVSYKGHVSIDEVKKLRPDEVDATSRISPHNLKRARRFSTCTVNVVLLDEYEKACDEIDTFFMGIFDDGTCTFANGIEGDFSNTIFILTMNLGMGKAEELSKGGLGFNSKAKILSISEIQSIVDKEMKKRFTPEFRNRFDCTLIFKNLTAAQMLEVVDVEINDVHERITYDLPAELQFALKVTKSARQFMLDTALEASKELRDLYRTIEKMLVTGLGRELVKGTLRYGDLVTVRYNKAVGALVFHNLEGGGIAIVEAIKAKNGFSEGVWSSDAVGRRMKKEVTKKARQEFKAENGGTQSTDTKANGNTATDIIADAGADAGAHAVAPVNMAHARDAVVSSADDSLLFDVIGYGTNLDILQDRAETLQEELLFVHRLDASTLLIQNSSSPLFIITVKAIAEQMRPFIAEHPELEIKARSANKVS